MTAPMPLTEDKRKRFLDAQPFYHEKDIRAACEWLERRLCWSADEKGVGMEECLGCPAHEDIKKAFPAVFDEEKV